MAVWYLDSDDEITDAVARLRGATEERVVFVVPSGSRIATGRINFRLLAREAAGRDLQLAVASPDAQVRAMASSAGVLALSTAAEAEAALERGDGPPTAEQPTPDAVVASGTTDAEATGDTGKPGRLTRRRLAVGAAVVATVAVIGVVASLQTLPTAQITLTPRTATIGPEEMVITAVGSLDAPDQAARRVPAADLTIPLRQEGTYPASGRRTAESRATGSVTFISREPIDREVPVGSRVETPDGVLFQTTQVVTLPGRAAADGPPGSVAVAVEAVEPGESGNVPAGAITVLPWSTGVELAVSNPEATSGGAFEQTPIVTQEDYDAAAVDLQNRLLGALAAYLGDPETMPPGLTVFAETARPGQVSVVPQAEEVVGREVADFTLGGALSAHVLGVDERQVQEMARGLLLAELPAGMAVLPGRLSVKTGEGVVGDDGVRFDATARADVYAVIDEDAVLERIAGLSVSEARAILEDLGATTVSVWPEFLGDLPSDPNRIRLDVQEPSSTE